MPKQALIVGSQPLETPGGVEQATRTIVDALESDGYRCDYLATAGLVGSWSDSSLLPWMSAIESWRAWHAISRKNAYDLAITMGPVGIGVGGHHSVHMYHGTFAEQSKAIRPYIRTRGYFKLRYFDGMVLERLAGRNKVCLANSDQTAREVREHFGYCCETIWYPIDTMRFRPGPAEGVFLEELGVHLDGRPVGLFVGTGVPVKGGIFAYEAMRGVPDMLWLALGDADRELRMLRDASNIVHHSRVEPHLMPDLFRSVNLVFVPSHYESFGLVVAEALACGTPVVATPGGASRLLMKGTRLNEFLVEDSKDVVALSDALRRAVSDLDAAQAAVAPAQQIIRRLLEPDRWVRRFLRLARVW